MRDPKSIEARYAEFYRLYTQSFRRDLRIYLELAAKYQGPVLEVGCRTGRVSRMLGKAGYEVTGVDTARAMLELAVEDVRPWSDRVRIADFDLRAQPLAERFPVALVTLFSFNDLIDVEEQRLFLRHVVGSIASSGVLALDLFCPISLVRPEDADRWRVIEREADGCQIVVRDRREMLTPLLERRTQSFKVDNGPCGEYTSHRRYIPPQQANSLLVEAGFENVRCVEGYDLQNARPIEEDTRPRGPFLIIGEL